MNRFVDTALTVMQLLIVLLMLGSWGGALDFEYMPLSVMLLINLLCVIVLIGTAWIRRVMFHG